ncbi:MAG: hypothetical protein ACKO04_16405 [Actinomycetes bacterium]
MTLADDLSSMVGVWHDRLTAWDATGVELQEDPFGGVPGPFPYENLVYCDFDGRTWRQTNVTFRGRPVHQRSFEADVVDGTLRFRTLGPEAPVHVGVSGGPGLIWFVAEQLGHPGLQRYCEPDLIRIEVPENESAEHPARRWRTTVLWRDGVLVRPMLVEGIRLTRDTSRPHALDPRGPDAEVHGDRSSTRQYVDRSSRETV